MWEVVNMHIVFAVLVFLLTIPGCNSIPSNPEKIIPIYSTYKNSAIYTSSGDFDGDGEKESIFITRREENYYISILDGHNIVKKELDYSADNFIITIQDINNDNREDIIINVIQNNCENCYVYSLDGNIKTLLSPDIIIAKIDLKQINSYISQECKFINPPELPMGNLDIKLYYTEMDYIEDGSEFISEGSIFYKDTDLFNMQAKIKIIKNGTAVLRNVTIQPTEN